MQNAPYLELRVFTKCLQCLQSVYRVFTKCFIKLDLSLIPCDQVSNLRLRLNEDARSNDV